jgi:hypothetical protein
MQLSLAKDHQICIRSPLAYLKMVKLCGKMWHSGFCKGTLALQKSLADFSITVE